MGHHADTCGHKQQREVFQKRIAESPTIVSGTEPRMTSNANNNAMPATGPGKRQPKNRVTSSPQLADEDQGEGGKHGFGLRKR
jgi:hypothetical protein